jgi:[ribosomal protein S5]-alanine N-acetyltransferase
MLLLKPKDSFAHWKRYATEAAYACIKYGFKKLNFQRIIERAVPDNIASLNCIEEMQYDI